LAWKALYGEYVSSPQGPGFMWWTEPAWSEVLFSSRNGLLPWSPLYALAGAGLFVGLRRSPRLAAALLVAVALQVLANGAAWDWWAGGSFGGRRFDSTFIAFCFGLGCLLLPSGREGAAGWRIRARVAAAALAGAVAVLLALGNLALAAGHSAPTVPIYGGHSPARVLWKRLPGPLGAMVAPVSALASAPARVLFALRHGTSLDAYDLVVGVHSLGELYPGLNSFKGKTRERILLDRPDSRRVVGLERGTAPNTTRLRGSSATILVGLNRRDPIEFRLRVAAGAAEAIVELVVNGDPVARGRVTERAGTISGCVERARRGVNVVEVHAPPGTVLYWLELRGTPDPLGRAPSPQHCHSPYSTDTAQLP